MKLLILSDIHSNIDSLEAILKREWDSDRIYCAGDLVDVGFHPKEVIACVRANRIISVRGNHDKRVVHTFRSGRHLEEVPNEELTWPIVNARALDEKDIQYLEALPEQIGFQLDDFSYSMQHLYKGYETIAGDVEFDAFWQKQTREESQNNGQRRLIFGHTHRQEVMAVSSGCLWMNPGSVGYNRPDDPSIAARYITITDGRIDLKCLEHEKSMSRTTLGQLFAERYPSGREKMK